MPQTECPAQEEAWRSTTERTPGAFRRLMSQCGSGVENCLLPDSVAGFVEGEHCSVLLKALGRRASSAHRQYGGCQRAGPKQAGRVLRVFPGDETGRDAHSHGLWQRGLLPDGVQGADAVPAQDMDRQQGRVCQ